MVIHFEKLSRVLDIYNENRPEQEQIEFCDLEFEDPLDPLEVHETMLDLLLEAHGY